MNYKNNSVSLEVAKPEMHKRPRKRYVRSLEYEVIANLALQQHTEDGQINFERLLSIPASERIPELINEYGVKRMHKLIKLMLQEFCASIALPKSKKLTEIKISVYSCDFILASYEDHFSLEDLIVFFENAKKGAYGAFKKSLTHYIIMEKLEEYRDERYKVYMRIKEEKEIFLKNDGPKERISSEPTAIKHLFEDGTIIPLKKIS